MWRLFAGIVVTAVIGFLAGSVAKSKGALTAATSNIPSVLIWILFFYLFGFSDVQLEEIFWSNAHKTISGLFAVKAHPLLCLSLFSRKTVNQFKWRRVRFIFG